MTAKEPQGSQILRDQFAAWLLMTVHHGELCAASLLCVLKERMKVRTDRQAGAQQSLHVTLEGKILYVMLRKTGRGGPPLLLKNRRRLCFPDAWLGAALRHVLGRLLPAKGGLSVCLSGALCLVGHGDDGKFCFTRGPQQIGSSEHPWHVVPPHQAPDVPPLQCSLPACLPGLFLPAALRLFLAEPSAASSRFQMFPSASHPAWLLSSKYRGPNPAPPAPRGCPRIRVGDAPARLCHPIKRSRLPGGKEDAGWCEPSLCFTISFLPL